MAIKVCGLGIISALGIGVEQNLSSLLSQSCGIGRNTLFATSIDVPLARVSLDNESLRALLDYEMQLEQSALGGLGKQSRTALLGALAAREAMRAMQIPPTKRVGLINSSSVGGMDLSEEFYREYIVDKTKGRLRDIIRHDCASSTDFIAQICGIDGFRTTISTACSSAANAVIMGARMLERGLLDYVLVGGVDSLCRFTLCGFSSLMILDGQLCRPFDRDRAGLNLGEGAAYMLLTKEEGGEEAICRLSGYANANDAFHQTASSSEGEGAFLAMKKALEMAGIDAPEIDYINLHGTGTQNNDASESAAIKRLFHRVPPCSSTKAYTGHTLAAAGALEGVFSALAIANGCLYGSLRFNSAMEGGIAPIQNNQKAIDVKHVLSNSFGFGGNCSSLIFSR